MIYHWTEIFRFSYRFVFHRFRRFGIFFHLHDVTSQLYQLFSFFFRRKWKIIIFFSPEETSLLFFWEPYWAFLHLLSSFFKRLRVFFSIYQVSFFVHSQALHQYFFPFLFRRTRHGGVWKRSSTGLETPRLDWTFPLKNLNHDDDYYDDDDDDNDDEPYEPWRRCSFSSTPWWN